MNVIKGKRSDMID
uniref:Uncharacterized protein n=1 Tax=Rhizophora mucronata TaxID=61149 RepID=A0A2P2N1L9_RHIMU